MTDKLIMVLNSTTLFRTQGISHENARRSYHGICCVDSCGKCFGGNYHYQDRGHKYCDSERIGKLHGFWGLTARMWRLEA